MKIYAFCEHVYSKFPEAFVTPFAKELLLNIVDEITTQYIDEQAIDVLYGIIPHINRDEITPFFVK